MLLLCGFCHAFAAFDCFCVILASSLWLQAAFAGLRSLLHGFGHSNIYPSLQYFYGLGCHQNKLLCNTQIISVCPRFYMLYGYHKQFSAWHPQFFHFCGCQALKHRVAPNRPVFWHHFDHFEGIFNINLLVMPARDKLWPLDKLTACHSRPERGRKRPKRSNSVQTVLASPNYFNNPSTDSPIICSSFASPKFSSTVAPTVPKLSTSGSSPKPSMEREYAKNGTFSLV